uniref:Uncharacterized protein n=1 Tax=Romanomermis culicivorax TaxID=13658 RepID=A0A915JDU1_ROMCU
MFACWTMTGPNKKQAKTVQKLSKRAPAAANRADAVRQGIIILSPFQQESATVGRIAESATVCDNRRQSPIYKIFLIENVILSSIQAIRTFG